MAKAMSGVSAPTSGLAGANGRVNLVCIVIGNQGGSHGSTLSIIPLGKAKEMESMLPDVPFGK